MKIKTADLIGRPLNWAVESSEIERMRAWGERVKEWWVEEKQSDPTEYSTDWLWGGEIIERERIELGSYNDQWQATMHMEDGSIFERGPTALIAAMRCHVASQMGDEVDVPDSLLTTERN